MQRHHELWCDVYQKLEIVSCYKEQKICDCTVILFTSDEFLDVKK